MWVWFYMSSPRNPRSQNLVHGPVLSNCTEDLGQTNVLQHIHTSNAASSTQLVQCISPHCKQEICTVFNEILDRGVMKCSTTH